MTISEKAAYLKGLADGLEIGTETKEAKLITAIIDLLGDMAEEFVDLNDAVNDLGDELDAISDDLEDVEDVVFDEEEHDHHDCCCGDDDDDDDYEEDDEPVLYTVKCPSCGNEITVDEDVLDLGSINCPNCNELLEFDFDEDECDCGCHDEEDN
jgi:hypothetical protein